MAKCLPALRKQPSAGSVQQCVSKQLAYLAVEQLRPPFRGEEAEEEEALFRGASFSQCQPLSPSGGQRSTHSAYPKGEPVGPLLR